MYAKAISDSFGKCFWCNHTKHDDELVPIQLRSGFIVMICKGCDRRAKQ